MGRAGAEGKAGAPREPPRAQATPRQDGAATALHTAAMVGSEEMARLLVAAGADPDAAMDDGRTPRSIAPDVFRGL